MLRSLKEIQAYTMEATDGSLGKAKDFYFDDQEWTIRYLVADTGKWLLGRQILISPESLGQPDWTAQRFPVNLTKEQIERSPGIETDKPVSLQRERQLSRYYQWPAYWGGIGPMFPTPMGLGPTPVIDETQAAMETWDMIAEEQANPHLRSVKEVTGYTIQAQDGEIGYAKDFIVDGDTWTIRYLVIDTSNWLPAKKVLVAPSWVREVSWGEHRLNVDLAQKQIENCPEYDPSTPVNRELEIRLYDYYGRPSYWS